MIFGIWLILLGFLAVPSLVLSRRPDAAAALAKMAPYQGWMGVVSLFWGVAGLLTSLSLLSHWFILGLVQIAVSIVLAGLGLILGIGVLKTFIKDPTAQMKMDQTLAKIAPFQGTLGIVAVVLGLFRIVASFIWY